METNLASWRNTAVKVEKIVVLFSLCLHAWAGGFHVRSDQGTDLAARAGDRCVALSWRAEVVTGPLRLLRSDRPDGGFRELTEWSMSTRSFADTSVENGRKYFYRLASENDSDVQTVSASPREFTEDQEFLEFLAVTAFDYFWNEANPENGLIRDRNTTTSPSSIAAIGFGLTGMGIGADHGWITREQGMTRALQTLRTLVRLPQGPGEVSAGYKGWFYHFLDMNRGMRVWKCELSSIDTVLLLAGVLYCREYFSSDHPGESEIRWLADQLVARVDWGWMLNGSDTLSMGWKPESQFINSRWQGYNEGSILYLLGIGAETPWRLDRSHWEAWTRTYHWTNSYGFSYVHFAPLFGHQYSACWIDLGELQDDFTRDRGVTYFENSRRATLAQQAYAVENPRKRTGYGTNVWGFTACDSPWGYMAHGTPPPENDNGTIAPTAIGGSLPFAPEECVRALRHIYSAYRTNILCGYGFRDAFNLERNWWGTDVIGIDQGAILLMIENQRTAGVWQVMGKNATVRRGLERAGFRKRTR